MYSLEFIQQHINKNEQEIRRLNAKYIETKNQVTKYEPLKKEYDRQIILEQKWEDYKNIVANFITYLFIFGIIGWVIWYSIRDHKRCMKLIAEGKMTQEEYDAMQEEQLEEMQERWSKQSSNPATGLPMHSSGLDAGGNARGCSSRTYDRYY